MTSARGVTFKFTRHWLWMDESGAPVFKDVSIPLVFTVWQGDGQKVNVLVARAKEEAASFGPGLYTVTACDPDTGDPLDGVRSWRFEVDVRGAKEAGWGGRLKDVDD